MMNDQHPTSLHPIPTPITTLTPHQLRYLPDVDKLGAREELAEEADPRRVRRRLEDQPLVLFFPWPSRWSSFGLVGWFTYVSKVGTSGA